jgi:CheY-like chemotaxis protein
LTGQLRTIVLDTSPTTRKVLVVILHREGHQVACFDDSLEALRALSRQGRADLLFLGLDLPKMDGFDVLKRLRGEPRFHSMGTVALAQERDGILVRQQIVDLVSAYLWQRTRAQESNWRAGSAALEGGEVAPRLERE